MSYLPDVDSNDYDWISKPVVRVSQTIAPMPSPAAPRLEWDRWLDMIARVGGDRGSAVAALSRVLSQRMGLMSFGDGMSVTELAIELLEADSEETCAVVTAMLEDGWREGIGKLLACARSLTSAERA